MAKVPATISKQLEYPQITCDSIFNPRFPIKKLTQAHLLGSAQLLSQRFGEGVGSSLAAKCLLVLAISEVYDVITIMLSGFGFVWWLLLWRFLRLRFFGILGRLIPFRISLAVGLLCFPCCIGTFGRVLRFGFS
jgi:hypothetical protein